MPISVVFDPPLPSDSPSTFNTKAFTLLGDLNDWSTQANALPGEVATNLTTLLASPPAIGNTTPAAGSFTTLSASGYTASSGYYINASTVLTPGATTQGTQFVTSSVLQWACGSGGYSWNNNANSASLMSMTNAGAVTIPGGITQESVIAPTLLNSWVNYGGSESTAGYWKDTFGVIHLRGLIKSGATTINTVLFTLPSGYRPIANEHFSISSNELFGNVLINSSGEVLFRSGSATWFSLSGITFKAA